MDSHLLPPITATVSNYPINSNIAEIINCQTEYHKLDTKSQTIYNDMMITFEHTMNILDCNMSYNSNFNNDLNPVQFLRIYDEYQNNLKKGQISIHKIYYKKEVLGLLIDAYLIRMIGITIPDSSLIYILQGFTKHKLMKIEYKNINKEDESKQKKTKKKTKKKPTKKRKKRKKKPKVNIPTISTGICQILSINHFNNTIIQIENSNSLITSFTSILSKIRRKYNIKIRLIVNKNQNYIMNSLILKKLHEAFIRFSKEYVYKV